MTSWLVAWCGGGANYEVRARRGRDYGKKAVGANCEGRMRVWRGVGTCIGEPSVRLFGLFEIPRLRALPLQLCNPRMFLTSF